MRSQPGDTKSVLEAFKPDEEPDDAHSIIGFTDESGGFVPQGDQEGTSTQRPPGEDARALNTRRGLW
jgi:penicillin-binding protein 1A